MIRLNDLYDVAKYMSKEETRNPWISGFVISFMATFSIFGIFISFDLISFKPVDIRRLERTISTQEATIAQQADANGKFDLANKELASRLNQYSAQCAASIRDNENIKNSLLLSEQRVASVSEALHLCRDDLKINNNIGIIKCDKNWDFSTAKPFAFTLQHDESNAFGVGGNNIRLQYVRSGDGNGLLIDDNGEHLEIKNMIRGREYCLLTPSTRTKIRADNFDDYYGIYKAYFYVSVLMNPYRKSE